MNTVAFRFDASSRIGIGHAMRCLELGRQLGQAGWNVYFVTRQIDKGLEGTLSRFGAEILVLSNDSSFNPERDAHETVNLFKRNLIYPNWCIVDHYHLDERWEKIIKAWGPRVAVVDDLDDRLHDCEILLDPNPVNDWDKRYEGKIPTNCRKFLGPVNLILRPEFRNIKKQIAVRSSIRRIGVTFGGGDPTGETDKVLSMISNKEFEGIIFEIVAGYANPLKEQIAKRCEDFSNVIFHDRVQDMSEFFDRMDLVIGAGGGTLWEAFSRAIPALVTIVASNQKEIVNYLNRHQLVWSLGWHEQVTPERIAGKLREVLIDKEGYEIAQRSVYDFIQPALQNEVHPFIKYLLEA